MLNRLICLVEVKLNAILYVSRILILFFRIFEADNYSYTHFFRIVYYFRIFQLTDILRTVISEFLLGIL